MKVGEANGSERHMRTILQTGYWWAVVASFLFLAADAHAQRVAVNRGAVINTRLLRQQSVVRPFIASPLPRTVNPALTNPFLLNSFGTRLDTPRARYLASNNFAISNP